MALAACGGEDRERAERDPFVEIERDPSRGPRHDRSAPRWESVAVLEDGGARARTVSIRADAIQWRARWTCAQGTLDIRVSPAPPGSDGDAEERCPAQGSEQFIGSGRHRVAVDGDGEWRLDVEQEVDRPLREPPLAAMRRPGARVLASGRFRPVERRGRGTALLYRLGGGRLALRLAGFETAANSDLFVWLSEARDPRTTKAALAKPYVDIGPLHSTNGDQNYLLPRRIDAGRVRSIVIWCEPVQIVYTAAALR